LINCRSFIEYENKTLMHTNLNLNSAAHLQMGSKTWRLTALAAAMGALLSVVHVDANALALGRITSLSSLGEPLVAGIDVPDINDEERASLKAALASPDAFRIAGMEYNPALASTQITLMRRDNGSSYLLLRSDKVVTDPFVNLVINANWSTGRIVRNYTLLLDPPAAKQSEAAVVTAPIAVLAAPAPQAAAPAPAASTVAPTAVVSAPVVAAPARAAGASPAPAPVAMPKAPVPAKPAVVVQKVPSTNSGEQIKVGNGDTAGKIAANNLPGNVSLEQMLVAMLRGNPQAFIGNNINRLKAGAILDLPTEAEANAIAAREAKQSVIAQSKDFNGFRRKLAENAPALASKSTDRVSSGKIEAKVEDQKATAVTPDKLTLSKGGLTAGDKSAAAAKENLEKIAKDRQAKDDAERSAELAKNIKDLNKIANAAPVASAVAPKAPMPAATVAVPVAPAVAAVVVATPTKAAEPAAPAASAVAVAPVAPVAAAPVAPKPVVAAKAPVVVAPVAEPSALDFLMDDPVVLPAAGGLLALLLAGGWYANSKRKKRAAAMEEEDALLDDHFKEESFFSDTSNEPVMEKESAVAEIAAAETEEIAPFAKPEMNELTAPAVNAHAVVDPLTEANVYLDYGRDVQAEEILKDGLKTQPENAAIYAKLMGIYAKRRDANNFEQMALKAKLLLTETDPQWIALSQQGYELEPSNTLYRAGAPSVDDPFTAMSSTEFSTRTVAQLDTESAKSPASVDLDLDFNFASSFPESSPAKQVEAPKTPLVEFPDFSLESLEMTAPAAQQAPAPTSVNTPAIAATASIAAASVAAVHAVAPVASNTPKPIEFDLGHLSLDLNSAAPKSSTEAPTDNNGPLETKLALAQEFRAIGDATGAKMLAHEVLALASGNLKTRAETLLAEIG
jgi:pilus assembly protein FimV